MNEEKKKSPPQYWKWLLLAFAVVGVGVVSSIDLLNQDGYILISTLDNETWNLNFNETLLPSEFNYTWTDPGQPSIDPLEDNSGQGNNLTNNEATYAPLLDAYLVNGSSSQYLSTSTDPIPNGSTTFSFGGWIIWETRTTGSNLNSRPFNAGSSNRYFVEIINSNGRVDCGIYGAYNVGNISAALTSGSLSHVLCQYNSTHINIFINGVMVDALASTPSPTNVVVNKVFFSDQFSRFLKGGLYDIRIWNRSLSAAEVATVYANGTVSDGLVAWYPFVNQSYVPPTEYSTLEIPQRLEPVNPPPGTLWTNVSSNVSFVRGPTSWVELGGNGSGSPGAPGTDGVGVLSALVLANGSLNVTLTNGTEFISGNLTGPQGIQGIPGTDGTNGINGTNGVNGSNWAASTEFMTNAAAGNPPFAGTATSSGGSLDVTTGGAGYPGVVSLRDSTTANGGYRWQTSIAKRFFEGNESYRIIFRAPATSGFRATATSYLGFHDATSITQPVDGCYLQITGGVATGRCRNNAGPTITATNFTLVANTWYVVDGLAGSTANNFTWSIRNSDGNLQWNGTVTGNIPNTSARVFGAGVGSWESTVDAAGDILWVDFMGFNLGTPLISR